MIPRRQYTTVFKQEAVRRVCVEGLSPSQVARLLGIPEQTLGNWLRASRKGQLSAGVERGVSDAEMELSRLRAENAQLKLRIDLMEAASAYFGRNGRSST